MPGLMEYIGVPPQRWVVDTDDVAVLALKVGHELREIVVPGVPDNTQPLHGVQSRSTGFGLVSVFRHAHRSRPLVTTRILGCVGHSRELEFTGIINLQPSNNGERG